MRVTTEESGEGDLTVRQLCDMLQGLPDNAALTIHTDSASQDGAFWRVRAAWDSSDDEMGIINLRGRDGGCELPPRPPRPVRFKNESERAYRTRVNNWLNPYQGQFGDH